MSEDTGEMLMCSTKYSPESEIGDDKETDVTCEAGEVMTDCSMVTKVRTTYLATYLYVNQ